MIQQWTRRYVRVTQPLGAAHKRARIRHYIINGSSNFHFLLTTDAVPTLLHFSVFLFFAGLLILLRHINHAVFNAVVAWVVLCVVVYAYITFLPVFHPDSPHYTPLSSLAWQVYTNILYPLFEFLSPVKRGIRNMDIRRPAARLLKRLEAKAEEIVLNKSPKLDAEILESLLVTLGESGALERFFEAIPGFYDSQVVRVQDVKENLPSTFFTHFRRTINQFLDQTLSSDSVSESVGFRRLITCLNAAHRVLGDRAGPSISYRIIRNGSWNELPPSPEVGRILRRWHNSTNSSIALMGSCIIARIIARVETGDDTWMALARFQLGVTEEVLRGYLKHGDSVLLANLITTTRLFFEKDLQFKDILQSISKFDIKETLPELQHDFCTLWNEIVKKNKHSGDFIFILDEIGHVYDALHPTTPTTIAALPISSTDNEDSLPVLLGSSYELCAGPRSHYHQHPPNESRQVANTLQDVSVSDPDVIVVTGESDVQDLDAHKRCQSDPPARGNSMGTSQPGESVV